MLKPILAAAAAALLIGAGAANDARPSFAEPSMSPDGREIAFASGGDIWTVPADGGEARLLVSHPAHESRPMYSPDGARLAFVSTRTGNGDIYVLTFATGELRRLTFDDAAEQLDGWSRDGRWVYFSSTSKDIAAMNDVHRVNVDGGTPMPVAADRYANEHWSAASPTEPGTVAITARGRVSVDWWRKGRSHIDESEIWLVRDGNPPRYEKLSGGGAKEAWPMWAADGRSVYFVSDRDGASNIWVKPLNGEGRRITNFRDGLIVWPAISADGRAIVFERNFGVWRLDPATGRAAEVPIRLRGAAAATAPEHLTLTNQFGWLALAPDGRKAAFTARGEVFAVATRDGNEAQRVTRTPQVESQLQWAPDSRRLAYVSARNGVSHLYMYDFGSGAETQLTSGSASDANPRWSPDGNSIAFVRGGRELRVVEVASRRERHLANGFFDRPPFVSERAIAWSPDGRWIAFLNTARDQFQNAFVVPATGGPTDARQVSFLPNVFGNTINWSPDGTYLLLDTGQRTEGNRVARIDLVPRAPRFRETQFEELFRQQPSRPGTPVDQPAPRTAPPARDTTAADTARAGSRRTEIVFDGIRQRVTILPVGLDVSGVAISPDGKTALVSASVAGQQNLYTYSLDELAREQPVARQLTSTPGFKSGAQFSQDGREVYYLENGRIQAITVESRQVRNVAATAELDVDFATEKHAVFEQAWTTLADNFYDPRMHGVDWRAVREAYEPRVAAARTRDELRRILALMVGELNASHTGAGGPAFTPAVPVGRLGLRFDRAEYERNGRLRVTELVPLGPAALSKEIAVGDYLLSVDGEPVGARVNLDSLLMRKTDRRVSLRVSRNANGSGAREVSLRPVSGGAEKNLLYRAWVEERREYVARASNGRLGYVHMPDMGAGSLTQLYLDLDTQNRARDGVVIDIRNNNGGFVHAYALDVFSRQPYLTMTYRGFEPSPARTVLGQRALEKPTVLVVNQHSLSDAEDFTEGYRAMGLGPVIGEPTSGWIIYTSNVTLVDGTSLRVPFIRITDREGKDMELVPRPVDVPVQRPVGESYSGRDTQLDRAVSELLARVRQGSGR